MSHPGALRVAIAGYGLAGEIFHAPLVAATEGLSLVAVTTSDEVRARRARTAYHGVAVKPDAETLIEAARAWPGVEGLTFLPYLAGERTPTPMRVARSAGCRCATTVAR